MIDANAPLSAGDDCLYGSCGAESATKASEYFTSFPEAHRFAVPSTFPHIHHGTSSTWTHSSGKKSRKDCILVPKALLPLVLQSQVQTNHDITCLHEDHLPLMVFTKGWNTPDKLAVKYQWDEEALLDPDRCQSFRQALITLPLPTWSIHVDDHAALFERHLLQLGQQYFAKSKAKTRPVQLQQHTKDAIAFKRQCLDYGRRTGAILDAEFKQELRLLEKDVNRLVRHDIQQHYDRLVMQWQEAGELSNHRLVYLLLSRLGRKKGTKAVGPRPLPMLRKPDGTFTQSFQEQQQVWMDQFSKIEAGLTTDWTTLRQQNDASSTAPVFSLNRQHLLMPGKSSVSFPDWSEIRLQAQTTYPRPFTRRVEKYFPDNWPSCLRSQPPSVVNHLCGRGVRLFHYGREKNHQIFPQRAGVYLPLGTRPSCTTNPFVST